MSVFQVHWLLPLITFPHVLSPVPPPLLQFHSSRNNNNKSVSSIVLADRFGSLLYLSPKPMCQTLTTLSSSKGRKKAGEHRGRLTQVTLKSWAFQLIPVDSISVVKCVLSRILDNPRRVRRMRKYVNNNNILLNSFPGEAEEECTQI